MSRPSTDAVLRAIADRTRLRILHVLAGGETCVGDLVTLLGAPQPTVSRHLSLLRSAGLVETRRAGQFILYSLAPPDSRFAAAIHAAIRAADSLEPDFARDAARAETLRAGGGCCPHQPATTPAPRRGRAARTE